MHQIKVIIIDDEWLIRAELKSMIDQYSHLDVVGEAASIAEGEALCREVKPDVIFLDIHLPGGSGFDFLDKVNGDYKIVLITGFDQYLNKMMQYKVIDCLMKPIGKDRLEEVIKNL
ncbi:MAG: response regulator [candidate division KSB1 bacterium]|jgi:two-component system LytT family response regulator|nr:response regulator [candidate division KSB1 bacterium]